MHSMTTLKKTQFSSVLGTSRCDIKLHKNGSFAHRLLEKHMFLDCIHIYLFLEVRKCQSKEDIIIVNCLLVLGLDILLP